MDTFIDYVYILYYIKNKQNNLRNYQYTFIKIDNSIIGGAI